MMKLRVKESGERFHESKILYNLAERNDKEIKIHSLDVETLVEEVRDLEFPIIPQIIQLPNNELFCLGSSFGKSIAWFIDCLTMKQRKWIELDKESLMINGASCIKNSIFIWARNGSFISLLKYDLATDKIVVLAPFPTKYDTLCHNVCFEGKILISTFISDLYVYDFEINSYSDIKVSENYRKYLLVSGKANAYYIQPFGDTYESEFRNPYIWNNIGKTKSGILWDSSWTSYNNFIFLRNSKADRDGNWKPNNWIYVFNLSDKSFQRAVIRENV